MMCVCSYNKLLVWSEENGVYLMSPYTIIVIKCKMWKERPENMRTRYDYIEPKESSLIIADHPEIMCGGKISFLSHHLEPCSLITHSGCVFTILQILGDWVPHFSMNFMKAAFLHWISPRRISFTPMKVDLQFEWIIIVIRGWKNIDSNWKVILYQKIQLKSLGSCEKYFLQVFLGKFPGMKFLRLSAALNLHEDLSGEKESIQEKSCRLLWTESEDYEWHLLINDSIALCLKQLVNYLITAFSFSLLRISTSHFCRTTIWFITWTCCCNITCIYI